MTFTPKAVLMVQETGFVAVLREFLFKFGLRETQLVRTPQEIASYVQANFWPLIFVEHTDGIADALITHDRLIRTPGMELLTFVFVGPSDKRKYLLFSQSAGARGYIKKPLQPLEAGVLIRDIIPPPNDPGVKFAMEATRYLLKGEAEHAIPILLRLLAAPLFARQAEIALSRCELLLNQTSRAEERLMKLYKSNPRDVLVLGELADYYRNSCQLIQAKKYYRKIRDLHSDLTQKQCEEIMSLFELDELDEAVSLLDDLQKDPFLRDSSAEGLAKVMYFMGLSDYIPGFLKHFSHILRQYNQFLYQTGKVKEPS